MPKCDSDQDLEECAGEVILDPWNDKAQKDWPNNPPKKKEKK